MMFLWSVSSKREQHESNCLRMNQVGDGGYYQQLIRSRRQSLVSEGEIKWDQVMNTKQIT